MKLFIGTILVLAGTAHAQSSVTAITTVQCFGKVEGKIESFKARLSGKRLVFWSQNKMVEAPKKSFFGSLADMENFGLEGTSSFTAKNGYRVLSVTNTAESIDIGVSPDLSQGFYNYRDGGSGNGNSRIPLICKVLPREPGV